jgi:hypothetical protein
MWDSGLFQGAELFMPSNVILAERGRRQWLTTRDVAKALAVTTRWVRKLANRGELACELTESGQHLFRRNDIRQVLLKRGEARTDRRALALAALRPRMAKADLEPRQTRMTVVPSAAEAKEQFRMRK